MICFDVYVNGSRICRAGIGAAGVLTTIVNWVGGSPKSRRKSGRTAEGDLRLSVGGLYQTDRETDVYPQWADLHLHPGDHVEIRVVEADDPDKPHQTGLTPDTAS